MLSLIICILLLAVPQSETQVSPPEHKTALMGITEKIILGTLERFNMEVKLKSNDNSDVADDDAEGDDNG